MSCTAALQYSSTAVCVLAAAGADPLAWVSLLAAKYPVQGVCGGLAAGDFAVAWCPGTRVSAG